MPIAELMTRETIIERYRERIALGRRTKLFASEFEDLVKDFIQRLAQARSRNQIQHICEAEIALLEEGYQRRTLAGDYIPKYRKAIEQAITDGVLRLNRNTAHSYAHRQRVTGMVEHRREHWALTYLKYDRETYEGLDIRQEKEQALGFWDLPEVNPHRYLAELEQLLRSYEKFKVRHWTTAIVGLTGLRLGELLASGLFTATEHRYLLRFEPPEESEAMAFEFITLIPAWELLGNIHKLRRRHEIQIHHAIERGRPYSCAEQI